MTAAAASCPLGPAHAAIKMRTHHPLQPSTSWRDNPVSGHERSSSSSSCCSCSSCVLSSCPAAGHCSQTRADAAAAWAGRGGAGSPGGGADCDNILCTALDWPPACTGRPPPRRPELIGAVFSRAACNPRLGRAADCHILARVTCHVSRCPHPRPGPALTVLLGSCAAVWVSAHWTLLGHRCPLHRHAL